MNASDQHLTPERLLGWFESLGIACPTVSHPPLYTVEDSRAHRNVHEGAYTKNLFLRNKKGDMWLLTLQESRRIELKETAKSLGAGNFSFASAERLERYLGVAPGAVSPLALANDAEGRVAFVIDREVLAHEQVHFHPLDNTLTTTLKREDFLRFLDVIGHPPKILDF